jgi:hypothetical protein
MIRSLSLFALLSCAVACGGTSASTPPPTQDSTDRSANEAPAEPSPTEAVARACGGMVAGQTPCAANEFCDFPRDAMCGAADATGVCRARPEMCTEQYAPVCGCDDRTFGNACQAASHGVSVATEGECPERVAAAGEICGTRGALPCGDGLFCDFPTTANCGRADAPGTCAPKPEICDARVHHVCGCDGTTYENECAAHRAGVSVELPRACRAP